MRATPVTALLLVSAAILGLTACAGGTSASTPAPVVPAQTPPTTLTGNWLLTGGRMPAVFPAASTSLFISGNQVTGQTAFTAQCPASAPTFTFGATGFPLTGTIANDGTFQATTGTFNGAGSSTFSLALTGNSPLPAAPTVWTGTYTLTFTPGTLGGCNIAQTENFAATPIAPLTGTYLGVPAGPFPTPFGAGAVVTLKVAQGSPTLITRGANTSYQLPLTASISITNSTCALSSSTSSASLPSYIGGDSFSITFPFGTGGVGVSGILNDATSRTFTAELGGLASVNGCAAPLTPASYTFTRQ